MKFEEVIKEAAKLSRENGDKLPLFYDGVEMLLQLKFTQNTMVFSF